MEDEVNDIVQDTESEILKTVLYWATAHLKHDLKKVAEGCKFCEADKIRLEWAIGKIKELVGDDIYFDESRERIIQSKMFLGV